MKKKEPLINILKRYTTYDIPTFETEYTEKLLEELKSPEPDQRMIAAEELGRLKVNNEQIINALKRVASSDSNKDVKHTAKKALYALGYKPFLAKILGKYWTRSK
jgi:HEAT repeat protein